MELNPTRTLETPAPGRLAVLVMGRSRVANIVLPDKAAVSFGRSPECDVVVNDDSVSRKRALFHRDRGIVEDLGSRNGTRVQGRRLGRGSSAPLSPGSLLELGSVTLVLHRASCVDAPPSAP